MLNVGQQALAELRRRTATAILPGREWILESQIMLGTIVRSDLQRFRETAPRYSKLASWWPDYAKTLHGSKTLQYEDKELSHEDFAAVPASAEAVAEIAKSACSAFLTNFVASGEFTEARTAAALLVKDLRVPDRVRELLEVFIERPPRIKDWDESFFRWLGALSDPNPLTPRDLYLATLTMWHWLPRTGFRAALESRLGEFLSAKWTQVVGEQTFAMKRPRQTVPAILVAAHDSRSGRARIASILAAAEGAVDVPVSPALRQEIRDLLG